MSVAVEIDVRVQSGTLPARTGVGYELTDGTSVTVAVMKLSNYNEEGAGR